MNNLALLTYLCLEISSKWWCFQADEVLLIPTLYRLLMLSSEATVSNKIIHGKTVDIGPNV